MTLRYVYGDDANVARFVARLIPHIDRGFPSDAKAIGITDAKGKPLAGIVFYHWNKVSGTTEMAIGALPGGRWVSRETLNRMYAYAFGTRGCQMLITRVRADNPGLLNQLRLFDYKLIEVPRLYGRHCDGVLATYTVDDWVNSRPFKLFKAFKAFETPVQEAA